MRRKILSRLHLTVSFTPYILPPEGKALGQLLLFNAERIEIAYGKTRERFIFRLHAGGFYIIEIGFVLAVGAEARRAQHFIRFYILFVTFRVDKFHIHF